MKKNFTTNDNEIDLIATFKVIWDGKIKIFLITTISFLIVLGYVSQIPSNYLNSLDINLSSDYKLKRYKNIKDLLYLDQSAKSNEFSLEESLYQIERKFIAELKDYEELLFILKRNKKIQKEISKFRIEDREVELYNYVDLLKIIKLKDYKKYTINFTWNDPEEAIKILQDVLNLTSNNLKKRLVSELKQQLDYKKELIISKDLERLDFLKEQSVIAKQLNISDSKVDIINISDNNPFLNYNNPDISYYLRGYRAIDKEIEFIQNREYQSLKFIEQQIDNFNDLEINFVDYNFFLIKTKFLKKTKLILIISVLVGLMIGVCFVLISHATQSQTISKKTK